jgi:hypothetical protein
MVEQGDIYPGAHRAQVIDAKQLLHPDLQYLAPILQAMHGYVRGIPWHFLRGPTFPLHHAHAFVALRRIIMRALLAPALQEVLDIKLRINEPRPAHLDRH